MELTGLLELPSRPTWSFPPRPWTSHVRWIAPSPHDADLLLVGIELGGLMRSTDRGETWHDHRPGAQRDVHSLAWHPQRRAAGLRGGRRRCGLERGRRRHLARGRRGQGQELHLVGRGRSGRPGALVRLGQHRPLRGPRRPRPAGADLRARDGPGTRSQAACRTAARDAVRAGRVRGRSRSRAWPTGSSGAARTAVRAGSATSSKAIR